MHKKFLAAILTTALGMTPLAAFGAVGSANDLTTINPDLMITSRDALSWHIDKYYMGPHDGGGPGWVAYYDWLTKAFEASGTLTGKLETTFDYQLMWADDFWDHDGVLGLTLDPNGDAVQIPVGSYTVNCIPFEGYTGYTTAPMAYYDSSTFTAPEAGSFAGKILVVETQPFETARVSNRHYPTDFEFRSGPGPFPEMYEAVDPAIDNSFATRWEFSNMTTFRQWAIDSGAVGCIIVSKLTPEGAKGLRQRTGQFDVPSILLDNEAGADVLAYLKANPDSEATIKLIAEYLDTEITTSMYFLPGVNYGQPNDEYVVVASHTDGLAMTQDNGCLGLLGIYKYLEQIPQEQRPRSVIFYLDGRHFITGAERAHIAEDLFTIYPELVEKCVAQISMEHMGELEGADRVVHDRLITVPTGLPVYTYIGVDSNDGVIDALIQACIDNGLERADIKCSTRPGINGGEQMGVGSVSNSFRDQRIANGKPSLNLAGNWPGTHTQIFSGLEWFSPELFVKQVAVGTQVVGYFMTASSAELSTYWGQTKDAIRDLTDAEIARGKQLDLLDKCDQIFEAVQADDFALASEMLAAMRGEVQGAVPAGEVQTKIIDLIDKSFALID